MFHKAPNKNSFIAKTKVHNSIRYMFFYKNVFILVIKKKQLLFYKNVKQSFYNPAIDTSPQDKLSNLIQNSARTYNVRSERAQELTV